MEVGIKPCTKLMLCLDLTINEEGNKEKKKEKSQIEKKKKRQ